MVDDVKVYWYDCATQLAVKLMSTFCAGASFISIFVLFILSSLNWFFPCGLKLDRVVD